ncbi:MAG: RloB family protein, partial [Prevotellaceae bacterium]|nr:RloB family protein [Prevotellaceae bacterium]
MARVKKIDNADLKRFAYKSNKSKEKRDLKVYFLIVCESEKTEPNYVRSFPEQVGKYVFDIQTDG